MSKFLRYVCCIAALFALIFAVSPIAFGQVSTATAFGDVTDSTGAEIPGATLVFTQTQTNFTRATATNGQGQYHAAFLPVGPYTVRVSAKGFQEMVQSGVVLTVTQQAALSFTLKAGGE
ncbi:MAG: carboxypeptidase-like regulatory domain-containing protein, partial [Acidobacteriaceae bacterium]